MRGEESDILLALRLELGILKLTSICEITTKLKKNKTNCLEEKMKYIQVTILSGLVKNNPDT